MDDLDALDAERLAALHAWTDATRPLIDARDSIIKAAHAWYEEAMSDPALRTLWDSYCAAHEALHVAKLRERDRRFAEDEKKEG